MNELLLTPEKSLLNENPPLYRLSKLGCAYDGPNEKIVIFESLTLDIQAKETIAIVGSSGSGKSSLLHILGSLATPSKGKLYFQGKDLVAASPIEKATLRNTAIGFIFQFHHLLPEFTTLENVAMPGIIGGMVKDEAYTLAAEVLEQVGLANRESHNVTLLSGGERQRAAIARAIMRRPAVLLADEPTGNLDAKNGEIVADLLVELNNRAGMAMIVVTHNPDLAARMGKCFELKSGDLYEQTR